MSRHFEGGMNIAMKVPPHEYDAVMAFYGDTLGLPPFDEKPPHKGFLLGPNRLWIDRVSTLSQAEVWLELFTPDHEAAASHLAAAGVARCDAIESLGEGFAGFWIVNPANIVHLVRHSDAF
jgi:hypothetical protein